MKVHPVAAALLVLLRVPGIEAGPPEFGPPGFDARPVSHLDRTSAVLHWRTSAPCPTRLQIREGVLPATTPGEEGAWDAPRILEGSDRPSLDHAMLVEGLEPATRYFYRWFDPAAEPSDRERFLAAEPPWSREYAFATLPPEGKTSFVRIPMKVLLVPNAVRLSTVGPEAPAPEPMPPEEIAMYEEAFRQSVLFYWVNSSMRYWIDIDFFVEPAWQRIGDEPEDLPDFYRGWPAARDGLRVFDSTDLENHEAAWPLGEKKIYSAQAVVICERRWDPDAQRWFYQGSGGGTFGIDWMSWGDETQCPAPGRSTFLGGSDIAWLNTHEYHHQMESQYANSGLVREDDRVVFCHFAPRYVSPTDRWKWDTAFAHGEHWDGIAWELRMLTTAQYFRNIFGEIDTAADADGDGIPDNDPRLPLDEVRLGSDPTRAATDSATPDMERLLGARWVPSTLTAIRKRVFNPGYEAMRRIAEGLSVPAYSPGTGGYAWIDFRTDDADGDGIADGEDPYPIYPWRPVIVRATIEPDGDPADWEGIEPIGALTSRGISFTIRSALDPDNLYYGLSIDGAFESILLHIDGDADGWYVGNDNLQLRIAPGDDGRPVLREAVAHLCGDRGWPHFDRGDPVRWKEPETEKEWIFRRPRRYGGTEDVGFAAGKTDDRWYVEIAVPNGTGRMPIQAGPGHPIGLAAYVALPEGGSLSVYEPYTIFVAEVAKEPESEAPAE